MPSTYEELLTARLSGLLQSWEERDRQAQLAILAAVQEIVQDFPQELLQDDDLSTRKTSQGEDVRLFPLGGFRRVWLEPMSGRTTLYIGSDGRLYEYGPAYAHQGDMPSLTAKNTIRLRTLALDELSAAELVMCRELLQRIWAV